MGLRPEDRMLKPIFVAKWYYRCVYCSQTFHPNDLTLDHIVPLSKGGKNAWSNIAPACEPCNKAKDSFQLHMTRRKLLHEEARRIARNVFAEIKIATLDQIWNCPDCGVDIEPEHWAAKKNGSERITSNRGTTNG